MLKRFALPPTVHDHAHYRVSNRRGYDMNIWSEKLRRPRAFRGLRLFWWEHGKSRRPAKDAGLRYPLELGIVMPDLPGGIRPFFKAAAFSSPRPSVRRPGPA